MGTGRFNTPDRTTYAAQSKTAQVLDSYGNTVTSQVYDYGNLSSPARTYSFQYLTASPYAQRYIRNRVASSTVTASGATTTLTTNTYDGAGVTDRTGLTVHDYTPNLYRGNLTRSVTPGAIHNTAYDIGGLAVTGDDGQGHSVTIEPAANTNSSLPGAILPARR